MTDLNRSPPVEPNAGEEVARETTRSARATGGAPGPSLVDTGLDKGLVELIELFFFAYRDFTGEADAVLAEYGFGRAHHRVLHFVNRHPDLRVADLLDILRITKQSLARVLRQLIEEGYVIARPGPSDRRERLLQVTPKGEALAQRLIKLQQARFERALSAEGSSDQASQHARVFLTALLAGKTDLMPERPQPELSLPETVGRR